MVACRLLDTRRREREWRLRLQSRSLDSAVDLGPGEDVPHLSSGSARLRAICYRRLSRIAQRHRTPGGSRGSRTKRPIWICGPWTWSGEYQRAKRKWKNHTTSQKGGAVDRLRQLRGVVLEGPTGQQVPEQRSSKASKDIQSRTSMIRSTAEDIGSDIS